MKKAQMVEILNKHGIPANEWTTIGHKISHFPLKTTSIITADDEFARYKFNNDYEMLEIVNGKTVSGIFVSDSGETIDYKTTNFIPYSVMYAVVSTAQRFNLGRLSHIPFRTKCSSLPYEEDTDA